MKFASFDIEIANDLPFNSNNWKQYGSLGITCAAVSLEDRQKVRLWQGVPRMTREESQALVSDLHELVADGYTLLTWNGCKFDFPVLTAESGLNRKCAELAVNHVDLMMIITFSKGYFLSLEAALQGAGLGGKLKNVTLNDGSVLPNMDGSLAPSLWAKGEHQAVLDYLEEDVNRLLKLAQFIQRHGSIRWRSKSGYEQVLPLRKFYTVRECFEIPEPDTSWMRNPPKRSDFVDWIPPDLLV